MFPENGTQLRFNNEGAHVMVIFSCDPESPEKWVPALAPWQ
jgi:hypothetical protein